MDQDVEKLNSIDGVTVEKLQGMAPGVSKTDAETLNELFEQRAVFGDFHERDREIIRCKLMSYKGIVPSLNLFHVHYKYLERWAGCMKMLLDKPLRKVQVTPCKEQLKPALRKIFSSNQSNGKCQVEISMNKWRDRSGSFEERFDWSYRQLWLFVMRDHSDEKSCIRGLAYTAQKLGFKSARIDEEAEAYENTQESTNLSRYRPSRRVTIGERISIQGRKAQDWEKEWRKGQHNLFLGEVESHRETAEEVTTLFLQKFIYHAFFGEPISRFWSQVDNHPVDDESSSDSDAINYYDALSETADGSSDDGFEVEQYTVFPEMPPPTSRSTAGTSRHFEQNIPIDANSQRGTGHRAICSSCGGISHVDTPNRLEREQHATISELSTEQTDGGLIDMNEVSDSGEMRTALDSCSVSSPIRFSTPIPSNGSHKCPESPLLGGREGLENQVIGNECVLYDPHGITAIGNHAAAVANTEDMVERVDPTSISQSRGLTTVIQRMNRSDYRYRPYTKKALSQQQNDHVLQAASSYHYLAGRHGKLSKKAVPSARRRQPSDPGYRPVCHSIDDGSNYEHSIHPPAEVDPDIEMAGGECVLYDPHSRHGTAAIGHDAAAVANTENTVERVDPTSISQSRGLTTVIQRMNRSDYRYRPYTKKALSQQQNDHVLQAASSYHYLAGRHGKLSKKAVPSARRRQPSDPGYRPVCHSIDDGSNYEHSIHPPAEADLDIQVAGNAFVLYDRQLEPREATTDNGGDAMEDTGEPVWSGDDNSDTAGSTTSSPGDTITELETLNYAHTVATLGSSRSSMVSSRSSVQRSSSSLDKGGLPSVTDISWTLVRSKSVSEMASESPRDPIVSWCPSTVSSPPEPRTSNQSETDLSVGPDIHATAYCISGRICEIEDIPPQAISNLQHFNGGIETVSELGLTDTGSASSASSEPKADTALAATTTKASTLPLPPLQPVAKDVHAEQWHTHTTDDHFASTLPYSEECYILDKDVYEPPPNPKNASSNLRLQPSEAVHNMSHQGEVVARLAKSQLEDTMEPKRTSQSHSTTIDFHQRRILAFNKHLHLRRKDHSPQTQNVSSSTLQTAPADATTSAARFEYQTPPRLDDYVFIVELNDEILVRSMEAAETEQIRHQIQTYEENTHVVFYTKALQRIPRPPSRNPCDPVDILCRLKVLVVMCTKWCIDDNIRAAVSEAVSKEQEIISYMCKKRKISGNVDGDRLLSNEQLYQRDGGERDNWQEYLPMSYREDETIEYTTERSEVALGKRRRNVQYD